MAGDPVFVGRFHFGGAMAGNSISDGYHIRRFTIHNQRQSTIRRLSI